MLQCIYKNLPCYIIHVFGSVTKIPLCGYSGMLFLTLSLSDQYATSSYHVNICAESNKLIK